MTVRTRVLTCKVIEKKERLRVRENDTTAALTDMEHIINNTEWRSNYGKKAE